MGERNEWSGGRLDMRTLCPFDEGVDLYAHFIYAPRPDSYDRRAPETWAARWMILGPADGSDDDPQRVVANLASAINKREAAKDAEIARLTAEVERLRGLVADSEWMSVDQDNDPLCWACEALKCHGVHAPDCPAFTTDGETR